MNEKQIFHDWWVKNGRRGISFCEVNYDKITNKKIREYLKEFEEEKKNKHKEKSKQRIVQINDLHIPYHDKKTIEVFIKFLQDVKIDKLVIAGDLLDFYELSTFDKDPKRKFTIQDEIDQCYEVLKEFKKYCPEIHFIKGNHESRLKRFLWKNPSLASIKVLELPKLLNMDTLGIEYHDFEYVYRKFRFTHGTIVRQDSGATAKAELLRYGGSMASGHCFDDKTEILTQRGWVNGLELTKDDVVGTMNKETRLFEWNKINEIYTYNNYNELYNIKSMACDFSVTDKHGLIGLTKYNKLKEFTAEEYYTNPKEIAFILALKSKDEHITISDEEIRLIINIVTDGHIEDGAIRWHLKKERKVNNLCNILDKLNLTYSKHLQKNGNYKIRLSVLDAQQYINKYFQAGKKLPKFFKDLTSRAELILNEYAITDGCKNGSAKNSYQIASNKEEEIDILQELFVKSGYRSSKIFRKTFYILTVNKRNTIHITGNNIQKVPYKGRVWCVNVDNGTLVIRRNGKTVITQNTHRLGSYIKTDARGTVGAYEGGCMCDLQPEYIEGVPNWTQGFLVFDFDGDRFFCQVVPILDHKFIFGKKKYQ